MSDSDSENLEISESQSLQPIKYTPELIRQMKAEGQSKPSEVTWGDWMLPCDELGETHKLLATLLAMGRKNFEIAQMLNLTEQRISVLKTNSLIKQQAKKDREELFGGDFKARLQSLLMPSISHLEDTLQDSKSDPKLRHDAAKYLIDQTIGKAPQKIEHKGDSLPQLLQLIHSLKQSGQVIDVTNSARHKTPTMVDIPNSSTVDIDPMSPTSETGSTDRHAQASQETQAQVHNNYDPIDNWVDINIPDSKAIIKAKQKKDTQL